MEEQSGDYVGGALSDVITKLRDLEEKQRILKDRLLLIGQNLIELREKQSEAEIKSKQKLEEISIDLKRIKDFIESVSSEFSKFARKDDLEILSKQAKMFQPLEFVRRDELERLKKA